MAETQTNMFQACKNKSIRLHGFTIAIQYEFKYRLLWPQMYVNQVFLPLPGEQYVIMIDTMIQNTPLFLKYFTNWSSCYCK